MSFKFQASSFKSGGFTFVEVILVLSIFSLLVVSISDLFMRAQASQRTTAALQKLQDDGRTILTRITQEVQTGGLDFDCYKVPGVICAEAISSANGNSILAIKTVNGTSLLLKAGTAAGANACIDSASTPCILISDDGGATWSSLTSQGIRLDTILSNNVAVPKLGFYISPEKNPFVFDSQQQQYLSNEQPTVSIAFTLASPVKGSKNLSKISLQTTVATREYVR